MQNLRNIETTDDFCLELHYANGEVREFDMKPLLLLKPWTKINSLAYFKEAKIFYNTVVWPGEIDIAPETLYLDSKLISIQN